MATIQSHKDLQVWQRGIQLVKEVYRITRKLPKEERYCLVSQMNRAALSIPSNIAEGYKRKQLGDYLRFLNMSDGSAAELDTQLILTEELYPDIDVGRAKKLLLEVQKMLYVLIKKLAGSHE